MHAIVGKEGCFYATSPPPPSPDNPHATVRRSRQYTVLPTTATVLRIILGGTRLLNKYLLVLVVESQWEVVLCTQYKYQARQSTKYKYHSSYPCRALSLGLTHCLTMASDSLLAVSGSVP
jgi:hypothetical protein